jgi:miniconductance mechanosensitive channel
MNNQSDDSSAAAAADGVTVNAQWIQGFFSQMESHVTNLGLPESLAPFICRSLALAILLLLAWAANWIAKRVILRAVHHVADRSKTNWDDVLVKYKVFTRMSHLAPAMVIYCLAPQVFAGSEAWIALMQIVAKLYMVLMGWLVVDALLNALSEIYTGFEFARRIPIRGFVQVAKTLIAVAVIIIVLAALLDKNPTKLLTGMGAMTAILMLVFKDSILGLVAGIQLSANRMVHIGEWIEMPKYGADGDVIDISLTSVKVQNWDKTISTIPPYALITDSFKNWRGMQTAGGRRIKRNIYVDMNSIRLCDKAMLERFKTFQYINEYIESKQQEITNYNAHLDVDTSVLINGRRLTNIGTFRAYLEGYLKHHPQINQAMTFLVRHLEPTAQGLPIQIYVFCKDKAWANYEAIQADIFDHILAVVPEFGLTVFQQPSGTDLTHLVAPHGIDSK